MSIGITVQDLLEANFTESEAQAVLSSNNGAEQMRLLRRGRGRLLEDIHSKQQALDQLDYFIHQLRQRDAKQGGAN